MSDVHDDPTFKVLSPGSDISKDKKSIIEKEKEAAIEQIYKVGSYREGMQDPYPSPFLNLSDMQIPKRYIEIFRWCKYFYTFDPLIAGAINSLATFPVTTITLEDKESKLKNGDSDQLKTYKRILFKNLNIYKLLVEIGIDYWLYGNCFIFGEMYTNPDTNEKEWKHVTRLDPSKMIIDVNPATQERKYKWRVPERIEKIVRDKKPIDEYNKIPEMIKKAVKKNQAIVIKPDNIYHFSRPSDSLGESAWGTPVVANVLKLLMYRNVLRQAQEAIAREHIVPFRIYYFEKTDTYNTQANWSEIAKDFAKELSKTSRDPNHKIVSPVPVNVLNLGGQGRALLLTPEIEQIQAEILAGMNVPREFIFGGIGYSGSSISLKILENHFITYRLLLVDFMQNFLIKTMAQARGEWLSVDDEEDLVTVKMTELKMQDDVQQKQIIIQLNAAGKITDEFMWSTLGIDADKMKDALKREALAKVELESLIQEQQIRKNIDVQKAEIDAQVELQGYRMQAEALFRQKTGLNMDGSLVTIQGAPTQQAEMMLSQQQAGTQQMMQPEMQEENSDPSQEQAAPQQSQTASQAEVPEQQNIDAIVEKLSALSFQQAQQYITQLPQEIQSQVADKLKARQEQQYQGQGYIEAQKLAIELLRMDDQQRNIALSKMPVALKQKVTDFIQDLKSQQSGADEAREEIDMRPMPEIKPPRRDSLK